MISRFTRLLLFLAVIMLSGCASNTSSVAHISLDFPHGSLRLLVQRSGDSRLFYGAAPASRTVKSGTFDIDRLFGQLTPRLHEVSPRQASPSGQPYGMVTFGFQDGSTKQYMVVDGVFAEQLFTTACANLEADATSIDELITAACTSVASTAP